MELINGTRFPAQLLILPDRDGHETLVVIWKGSWRVDGGSTAPLEEPTPITQADEYHGKPGESSLSYESDLALWKPATDVVLLGHAYAPDGKAKESKVQVRVGPVAQSAIVSGDRKWKISLGVPHISGPEPFEKIPLVYERSFGGAQPGKDGEGWLGAEERNPIGAGYVRKQQPSFVDGLALPNIEEPKKRISKPVQSATPVGFGFVGRHWLPRRTHAGTYDAKWQADRAPLLPEDFDERYFNGAPEALQAVPHLRGGEPVQTSGVHRRGAWSFALPPARPVIEAHWKGDWLPLESVLDTVVLEPDSDRVSITHRARLRIHNHLRSLKAVRVKES